MEMRHLANLALLLLAVGLACNTAGPAPVEAIATEPPVQGPPEPPHVVSSETTIAITVNPWACPAGPEFVVATNNEVQMTNIFNNQVVGTITLLGNTLIAKADGHHKEIPLAKDSYEVSVTTINVLSDGNGEVFITNYTVFVCNGYLYYLGEPEPMYPQTDA